VRTLASLTLALGLLGVLAQPSQADFLNRLGIGAYSGVDYPIVQDDAGTGPLYGIRGRIGVPVVTIEPAVTFVENADRDVEAGGSTISLEAPGLTSYSFSLLWGRSLYGLAGIGWSTLDVPNGAGESTEPTYYFGGGGEIGIGPVAVDISPRFSIIQTADNASRKHFSVLVGVNYYFGSLFAK
jgi:hypothetical protein